MGGGVPRTAGRIAADGHLVGHHSHYHARMPLLLGGGFDDDLSDGARAIEAATGVDPHPWFRCPFGAGADDPRVLAEIERHGVSQRGLARRARGLGALAHGRGDRDRRDRGCPAHGDGTVVLLHTWPGGTAEALARMIDGLRELGATFVTIDALEELP